MWLVFRNSLAHCKGKAFHGRVKQYAAGFISSSIIFSWWVFRKHRSCLISSCYSIHRFRPESFLSVRCSISSVERVFRFETKGASRLIWIIQSVLIYLESTKSEFRERFRLVHFHLASIDWQLRHLYTGNSKLEVKHVNSTHDFMTFSSNVEADHPGNWCTGCTTCFNTRAMTIWPWWCSFRGLLSHAVLVELRHIFGHV
jgi:hypothetical protein